MADTAQGMSLGQVMRALDVSATRVRQLADAGRLAFEVTALGRLYDPESVRVVAAERADAARENHRIKPPAIPA